MNIPEAMASARGQAYPDTGCAAAECDSCLKCPLPKCVEDMDRVERSRFKRGSDRDREWVHVIRRERLSARQAAERFGVAERTIYRVKARVLAEEARVLNGGANDVRSPE